MTQYVDDCNELNNHIEMLKQTYDGVQKLDYGSAEMVDNSRYNFKRSAQVNAVKSQNIYDCTATVCKNAEQQPFKYLTKYFNIKTDEATLIEFEQVLNNFNASEEGKNLLLNELETIKKEINDEIPRLIQKFGMKNFMKQLGFQPVELNNLHFPVYTFRYVSPGGNKSQTVPIVLNLANLERFVVYLSELVKFKKSVAGQRALMTSRLRQQIKERDNHTCQNCENSTYNEPNLLLEIDHIVPVSKGGLTTEENLQVLCWKCNRTKGARI